MVDVGEPAKPPSWSPFGSYAESKKSSDGIKGYKSVTFRPTSPRSSSSLPSAQAVKHPVSQQTSSSSFSSDPVPNEPTVNGAVWRLPVKIRAQKLESLATPFNDVGTSKSATFPLSTAAATPVTSSTSTSFKWTPTLKTEQKRSEDGPGTPTDKPVAAISVLKHDQLDGSASLPADVKPPVDNTSTSTTTDKNDDTSRLNAFDISDIENSLNDEWWDSLFKPSASEKSKPIPQRVEHSQPGPSAPAESRDPVESVKSTAAALRLSDALQRAPRSETGAVNAAALSGQGKTENDSILSEWQSDISTYGKPIKKGPRVTDYDKQKESSLLKPRPQGLSQRDAKDELDSLYAMLEQPRNQSEKKLVTFEGIGPTDDHTGVPIATRVSIEEGNRKDWYRHMYKSLHKHRETDNSDVVKSPSSVHRVLLSPDRDTARYPSHYKYIDHRFKNQPMKIEDYEPGFHSSIAQNQAKTCESERLLESLKGKEDYETDGATSSKHSPSSQRKHRSGRPRSSGRDNPMLRQKWDEENFRRRLEVERVLESERHKRHMDEKRDTESRKHSDYLNPLEKCSMLLNRFDDDLLLTADALQRPEYRCRSRVRGKARAIHTFRAQNKRELPLRKGDTVYLLQQLDRNWFKGERHGAVGVFPVNYVEVLTSLDEAYITAGLKEGKGWAKYSFKGQSPKELSLRQGDVVKLIRRLDENWYEARAGDRQGIVPVIYVETTREPETPLMTPVSSRAPTPTLGTGADAGLSGRYSPASSVASNGPDVPTAPESPWMSDFYDSEVETDNPSRRHGGNRYASSSRENTVERPRTAGGLSSASRQPGSPSTTNYMPYRSRNILDRGPYHWPTSAPSTLERTSADDRRSNTVPRDLYDIARRRRADDGAEADTGRLDDWINGLLSPSATTGPTSTSGPTATSGPASSNTLRAQSSSPLRSQPTTVTSAAQPHRVIDTKYPRYRALYDYAPRHIDELQLMAGDVLHVMEMCDDGWYVGTSGRTGEFGTFPGNYVEPVAAAQ